MPKGRLLILFLLPAILFGELQYSVENTNITLLSDDNSSNYNYDRLRFRGDYTYDNLFTTFIVDGVNYLGEDYINSDIFRYVKEIQSDTPFKTQTVFKGYDGGSVYAKVYRAYAGYEDGKNRVVVGLQNITMGVGRIWTPTNLYNPKNSYALESAEVFGVAALLYTRYLDDTSHISVVASQNADDKFQYGARYKAYLSFADFAVDVIISEDVKMFGYEIEANLGDTGMELRSEGAYIKTTLDYASDEDDFFQAILGFDYGFKNGINVMMETLYSSQTFSYDTIVDNFDKQISSNLVKSNFYVGGSVSYNFNIFLDGGFTYIENFEQENSYFFYPTLNYSYNDYNTFSMGAIFNNSEQNSYFFKYILLF